MLLDYGRWSPLVESPVFLAPGAYIIGQAHLAPYSSVWFNAVIRADAERIVLGQRSNLQDNAVIHADPGFPCVIGTDVTIGHGAVIHGAIIADQVLIGMGCIVMNGAEVGSLSIIGAGSLITEGAVIPSGSLVYGRPGRVIRTLSETERQRISAAAAHYVTRWLDQGWHSQ